MAVSKQRKQDDLRGLTEELENARGVVFSEYGGMTVKEIDELRKKLRAENVRYQVVKVTLLKKALAALGIKGDDFKYNGPVAVAFSQDEETAPARILKSMSKGNPKIVIDGGVFNKELVAQSVIEKLASLPTKEQLLGQLLSVLNGPARGLVTVLSGNTRNLVNVLNALADKKK
jgi:large subunit ribosomal protein L10